MTGQSNTEYITFKVNQPVVYPLQGVGVVKEINERPFKGEKIPYYEIFLDVPDMTVLVPVHNASNLGIRPIVTRKDANQALDIISEEYKPVQADWKMRYQMNVDLIKEGSVLNIATVVRSLYHRSKVKELPILEKKLYDNARRLLIDELTYCLEMDRDEVEQLVFEKLESE